jgi:hypothetical protein
MDSTKPLPDDGQMPGFGMARDLKKLKVHGAASAAELQEFLAQMRGRSPQEVLGMLAASRLMRSIAIATIGAVLFLVVGSAGPWWWYKHGPGAGAKPDAKAAATASSAKTAEAAKTTEAAKTAEAKTAQPAPSMPGPSVAGEVKPSPADAEKAVKVMGLNDTKMADPKTNPMDRKIDDLLDGKE